MHHIKLAKLLKTLRLQSNISQTALAETLEMTKQSLSLLENGHRKVSIERAAQIAEALGHELIIEVLPKEAVVPLSLFRELAKLNEADQKWLAAIAESLPRLQPHQREAIVELAKVFTR